MTNTKLHKIAERNIRIQTWVNFLAGIVFLLPIITIFYKYVGLSLAEMILVANVSSFTVAVLELPTSVWADTAGRRQSMIISVSCNFLSALAILLFPTLTGFIIAAFFSGLYFSFWSGTGQAFLAENLDILGRKKEFGKIIGHFMSMETLASLVCPLAASGILLIWGDKGYTVLAALDVVFALALVFLTLQLREPYFIREKLDTFRKILQKNYRTAKDAIKNIVSNNTLKTLLIYRSLANHVAFLYVISQPVRVENGMEPWMAGVFGTIGAIGMMLANKFAYKLGEKISYNFAWVMSTICQAVLLILAGLFLKSWIFITVVMILFNTFEGLWQPSWNHVLVENTKGNAIATTRSIIFGIFALYTTAGKQLLSIFPVEYALIGIGVFILLVNVVMGKKILKLQSKS